ncbi:MAG: transport-associated protein [Syntrophus sp. (in: bacteria)]|nr:transport-associated protein [Syntrophus sp. (in: bacteria)]
MKAMYRVVLMMSVVAMLAISVPVCASEMDDRIESSARKSYTFKTYLQADDITIKSMEGVVSLTGTVSEESHKSLAEETVASLPGVKSVDNRLLIKGMSPNIDPDVWLMEKVRATLVFHRSVDAGNTNIYVKDSIVTLRGEATSQAQKDLTTEYAKDVEGVKDVKNEMIVSKVSAKTKTTVGEDIDDASITAQVKMSLLYHRSTSAINTKVETKNGVVTLFGKARTGAEKDLAAKFANDISGVKSVNNRMTIE